MLDVDKSKDLHVDELSLLLFGRQLSPEELQARLRRRSTNARTRDAAHKAAFTQELDVEERRRHVGRSVS